MSSDTDIYSMGLVREPLHEQIADRIQQLVAEQRIEVGGRLPSERDMALQLKVSRPTVREAMRLLEHRGLVIRRAGSGTYLIKMGAEPVVDTLDRFFWVADCSFEDLMQVRSLLEPGAAASAAGHASAEGIARLQEQLEALEEAFGTGVPALLAQAEADFHIALARASGNQLLAAITTGLTHLTKKWTEKHSTVRFDSDVNRTHRMMVEAIVARDPDRAREAASQHMHLARQSYIDYPVEQASDQSETDR